MFTSLCVPDPIEIWQSQSVFLDPESYDFLQFFDILRLMEGVTEDNVEYVFSGIHSCKNECVQLKDLILITGVVLFL